MTDVLLATSADLPEGEPGGELLLKALAARDLTAAWASWDDPAVDWSSARLVTVRSTWDYAARREEFLGWADHVERWTTLLHGAAALRWNTDKRYLLDLARAGVPVVPTVLLDDSVAGLAAIAARFPGRVLAKPRVGAGGRGLVVVERAPDLGVPLTLGEGPWVVQPVVESVRTEGEVSIFVIAGAPVSQCRKLPQGEELRVNEQYGGSTVAEPLADETMLVAVEAVAAAQLLLDTTLTCARVDLVRLDTGQLVVSELEVTEPGLYLDVLPGNAAHFAEAVAVLLAG